MLPNEQKIFIDNDPFLTIHQARNMVNVSESTWRRGVKSGLYPKPAKVSARSVRWRKSDIELCRENFPSG